MVKEAIGVCAMITPWNWPLNQIACKVAPAIAVGCTMILKPSELTPLCANVFAQIMHDAGVPAGVFNVVQGDGSVGELLSLHSDVDLVSITGSTQAGIAVARNSALTVKRVTQELGGKSANIILDDANFTKAVSQGVYQLMNNSGQTCVAPSRMLVPKSRLEEVEGIARGIAETIVVGAPDGEKTFMGPVVSQRQFSKTQDYIKSGIEEGAELLCGGLGRPEALTTGYYVRPTIFSRVSNQMRIAREEIFGPVLTIIPYDTEEEAIAIANDSDYGLAGYVQGADPQRTAEVAARIRAGSIFVNGAFPTAELPLGGYKQSGNGRECGEHGFSEYLEIKSISGLRFKS